MNEELLEQAKAASAKGPLHAAQRILLFPQLVEHLETCFKARKESKQARKDFIRAVQEFKVVVRDIETNLDDWNVGVAVRKIVARNTRTILKALDDLEKSKS